MIFDNMGITSRNMGGRGYPVESGMQSKVTREGKPVGMDFT
jgi:hypothetical protein